MFFCYLKISDDMSGARAAIRDTIPFPTWGSNLRFFLKYPNGSFVLLSISFV